MLPRRLSALAPLLLLLTGTLPGCGYHTAGQATHIPQSVHVIDVPIFKNLTQTSGVEVQMTEAVLKELESRTAFKAVSRDEPGSADAVLSGTVTTFSVFALTYDSTTNQSSSYEITIGARVRLTDRDGRVLYQNNHYIFRQQYESTQDLVSFIQEDPAAVHRLARDFAENLVSDMTASF